MNWNVDQAKQKLSQVLKAAADEPQRSYNRRRLGQSRSQADMLIAATAKVRGLTLVTRRRL